MATYLELYAAANDPGLVNRTRVACLIAAETIGAEADATTNHANRLKWAKAVFNDPIGQAAPMLNAILAKNKSLTPAALLSVTDAALQTAVDSEVNVLAQG